MPSEPGAPGPLRRNSHIQELPGQKVHPRVGGNYPRQISKIEAYGAEIFPAHEGSWEKGIPAIF